ncbi:L,D-transpeptidase family protein [Sphingobium sp. AP49]|uniref:L,D-transpeptidase family protein n=1 Tax=Sphingobium sp. AP49 TaxID=1144307 RepID=UPI00026EE75B|nr:L,D-transpeptidase family protein [Sphingobium sp. AP49]WHO40887.1 L,D-transpeptidase family protein [Sphingobium sp. AP49]
MAGVIGTLVKNLGPKLLVGAGLGVGAFLLTDKLNHDAADATATKAPPAVAAPKSIPLVERRSDQGMKIDPHALAVKRVLKIEGPFEHGDYAWDEEGAPAKGPVIITVDLKAQTLSVFRDGYEIGAAVILYGATDKQSPLGAFPIMQKDADHYSSTYNNAPMPYMQRLTSDGVAIHGSDVKWGYATHGCIGVPREFAQKLFGVTKVGDMVIITNGKMLDTSKAVVSG